MSASDKKKLRKETEATVLTEKQKKQMAEAKKLKRTTVSFIAIMLVFALIAGTILGTRAYKTSGIVDRLTIAATTGTHKLDSVMVNYYYIDYIRNMYEEIQNSFGTSASMYLGYMGINANEPLNTQPVSEGATETWADYYLKASLSKAKNDLALCDKANAEGFVLSQEDEQKIEANAQMLKYYAAIYGYRSVNKYLKAQYGNGANLKSYNEYVRITTLAAAYYNAHNDSLSYDNAAIEAFVAGKEHEYSDYSYAVYTVNSADYLTGGTKNEDGSMTYTDDEKNAAKEEAKKVAAKLEEVSGIDDFDTAISELEVNQEPATDETTDGKESTEDTTKESTDADNEESPDDGQDGKDTVVSEKMDVIRYGDIPEEYRDWIAKEATIGQVKYFEIDSDTFDVVCLRERIDNKKPMVNVRHLLVEFEGGTTDAKGNTTYSADEEKAAKDEAERLLQLWKEGAATEESFTELLREHSDDRDQTTGEVNNDGLYEDINPGSNYVPEFLNWCVNHDHKTGNTDVIRTDYGYHIMYFVGYDEVTYRDYMVTEDMRAEDLSNWYNAIVEPVTYTIVNTKRIKMDFVMATLG